MSTLAPSDPRADLVRETAVAVVINSALSLVFALLAVHGRSHVPMWGMGGIAFDFLPQLFMMVFATTLAVTLLTRRRMREGKTFGLPPGRLPLPENAFARAVLFGLLAALALAPISVGALTLAGVGAASSGVFLISKVIYGALVTVGLAPMITLAALRRPKRGPSSINARTV